MQVSVLALDDVFDLGLSAVLDAFQTANELIDAAGLDVDRFDVSLVGVRRAVRTSQGLRVPVRPIGVRRPDCVVVPAVGFKMPGPLEAALARQESWHLVVAGYDRHQARYEDFARRLGVHRRTRFLGGQKDVRPLYAAADAYVMPSRYEPFGNAGLEALAMGLPSVISTRCGAAELVDHGKNGWKSEADDARRFAELMAQAVADEARQVGERARAAAEGFGFDAMARRLMGLYASLKTTIPP